MRLLHLLLFLGVLPGLCHCLGCASDSAASHEEARRLVEVAAERLQFKKAAAVEAIRGFWRINPAASAAANPTMPAEEAERMRRQFEQVPFDLEITAEDCISRSRVKIIPDTYTLVAVRGDEVVLSLGTADAALQSQGRGIVVAVRGDQLFITAGRGNAVMDRIAEADALRP